MPPSPFTPAPRCRLCPSPKLPIEGNGPVPCGIMAVGEAPGKVEDRVRDYDGRGEPFHGDSGQELNQQYFPLAGLTRGRVYVTNLVRCIPREAGGTPTPSLARCCADAHMAYDLRRVNPKILVTLGAVAYRTLFPSLPPLELQHGIPIRGAYRDWEGWVYPTYHPAAGLRSSEAMLSLQADFRGLGEFLRGVFLPPVETPRIEYFDIKSAADIKSYLSASDDAGVVGMDTEVESLDTLTPYCLSLSGVAGTGVVVRAGDEGREAVEYLGDWVRRRRPLVALHNAPFDLPVLAEMGVEVERFHDTMVDAYNLQLTSQSLKVLGYRWFGVVMREFKDVAFGPSRAAVLRYLGEWVESHAPLPVLIGYAAGPGEVADPQVQVWVGPGSEWENPHSAHPRRASIPKLYREWVAAVGLGKGLGELRGKMLLAPEGEEGAHLGELAKLVGKSKDGLERVRANIKRLVADVREEEVGGMGGEFTTEGEDEAKPVDPWDRIKGWDLSNLSEDSYLDPISIIFPGLPKLSLVNVEWKTVVQYAAQDADITRRLYYVLRKLRPGVAKKAKI